MRIGRGIPARPTTWHATFSDHLTEDFNTTDAADIQTAGTDLKWGLTTGVIGIVSNEATSTSSLARARAEHLLDKPDMWVECRALSEDDTTLNSNVNLALRVGPGDDSNLDMYVFGVLFSADDCRIVRTNAGTSTNLTGSVPLTTPVVADTYYGFRFTAVGQVLTGYIDYGAGWVEVVSFTDSSPPADFVPGLSAGFAPQIGTAEFIRVDDWEAGTEFGTDATVTPGVIAVGFSVPQVSVSAGSTVTPGVLSRAFDVPQAAPSAGASITPATLARLFAVNAASPSAGVSLTPTTLARAFVIDQASPQTAGNATVNVAVLARAFVIDAAEARASSSITPTTLARVFVVDAVSLSAGTSVTPGTLVRAFIIPAVTVTAGGGATVQPDVVARAFAVNAVTISAGVSITPATLARLFAIGQAVASGGTDATQTPAVLALALTTPAPSLTAGASPVPSPVVVLLQVPAATAIGRLPDIWTKEGPQVGGAAAGAVLRHSAEGPVSGGSAAGNVMVHTREGP